MTVNGNWLPHSTELVEERMINLEDFFSAQSKLFCLKKLDQSLAINHFNWKYTIAVGFLLGFGAEPTSRDKNSFIRSPHYCISKISNLRTTN